MKDALNEDNILIEAGPDAPEVAMCLGMPFIPACEGVVILRSRRVGRDPEDKTWFYRHRGRGVPAFAVGRTGGGGADGTKRNVRSAFFPSLSNLLRGANAGKFAAKVWCLDDVSPRLHDAFSWFSPEPPHLLLWGEVSCTTCSVIITQSMQFHW